MKTALTDAELDRLLPEMDGSLLAEGLPLYLRPQECFKQFYGLVHDKDGRQQLFEPIMVWFVKKYGYDAMDWDRVIGRFPVRVRGGVYLVQVPLVLEETVIKLTDRIEGLPQEIRDTFKLEEFKTLGNEIVGPTFSYLSLYTLNADDVFLRQTARELVRRGLFDIENATHSLVRTGDVQGAIFHAHAAAEKFLKAALSGLGSPANLKLLGHNIPKAFAELTKAQSGYEWLRKPVEELQRLAPSMELRYSTMQRSLDDGITAIQASLFLCGSLAQMWMFEHERGSRPSAFVPGRFYKDGRGSDHYCKTTDANQAVLGCFRSSKHTGRQIFDKLISLEWSPLYLEVYDQAEESRLRRLLLAHLRQPGIKVDPQDLSITHTNSPKGTYTTGIIRRKVTKT